jgi:DNA polymerase
VTACRRWLLAEVELLEPGVIVAMGATAAHSLFGRATAVQANRGQLLDSPLFSAPVLVTVHPSSILRQRERETREAASGALADDLRLAASSAGYYD